MRRTANQGKGVRGGACDMAAALLLAANLSERQPLRLVPFSAGVEQAERTIGLSNVSSPIWERNEYVCFQAYHGRCLRRSEEHTSELQSLMRISYAVFCLKKKNKKHTFKTLQHYQKETRHKH